MIAAMRRAIFVAASTLIFAPAAAAATTNVNANGNVLTDGLSFTPATITVAVGDTVRWTNTDFLVPHTATEDHDLWDLAGSYGATPVNPAGFGPGTSVQRVFEAGTAAYYCRVHPTQMRGVVAVPVTLGLAKRRVKVNGARKSRLVTYVSATWASAAPVAGEAFDVQVRRGLGPWRAARTGTTQTNALIRAGRRGTVTHVRARLRKADNADVATGWSPDAQITAP
jgi:plastocyanin